jgi:hypothetical protein
MEDLVEARSALNLPVLIRQINDVTQNRSREHSNYTRQGNRKK